jgi:hypothetical protein
MAVNKVNKAKGELNVAAFIEEKPSLVLVKGNLEILAKAKVMHTGRLGWTGTKPNVMVVLQIAGQRLVVPANCNCTMLFSGKEQLPSEKEFLAKAKPWDCGDLAKAATSRQFKTGSIGWNAHDTIAVRVGKKVFSVNRNLNIVLKGTKDVAKAPQQPESRQSVKRPIPEDSEDETVDEPPQPKSRKSVKKVVMTHESERAQSSILQKAFGWLQSWR